MTYKFTEDASIVMAVWAGHIETYRPEANTIAAHQLNAYLTVDELHSPAVGWIMRTKSDKLVVIFGQQPRYAREYSDTDTAIAAIRLRLS